MGGKKGNKSKKKKTKVQLAAQKRHENFKKTVKETGKRVQTFGGTKKKYTKAEARALEQAHGGAAGFSRVTGGAANPLNRADTSGIKVGPMKEEFKELNSLLGTDYSNLPSTIKGNPYDPSLRSSSDFSFADSVRAGARFNEPGRNDMTGGKDTALLGGFQKRRDESFMKTYEQKQEGGFKNSDFETERYNKLKQKYGDEFNDQSSLYNTGALTASHDNRLFKSVPATGPAGDRPASKDFIDGALQKNIAPSTPGNLYGIKLAAADPTALSGLGIGTGGGSEAGFDRDSFNRAMEGNYDPESSGGLNIGSSAFGLSAEQSNRLSRALADGPSSRMLSEGGDLQFSDMFNADTPGAKIAGGINTVKNKIPLLNRLPDMKINSVAEEAQRRYLGYNPNLPASALARMDQRGSSGPRAAVTVAQQVAPETQPVPSASTTPSTQTGVDPNRLLQIQQQAYQQAYNPMSIGGFNPQFRFASRAPSIDYSTYFNYS